MRVGGGGLFVFFGLLLLVGFLSSQKAFDLVPSWLVSFGIVLFMLALMALSLWLFNPKGTDPFGRKSVEEHTRELEGLGLLESVAFKATRAFGVQEFDDEGLHYFIELADGRILYLSGQYLYDYAPISDDPDVNQPQSVPIFGSSRSIIAPCRQMAFHCAARLLADSMQSAVQTSGSWSNSKSHLSIRRRS